MTDGGIRDVSAEFEQETIAVADIPGIGSKTATNIRETTGIETADELAVAYFGEQGSELKKILYSPQKVTYGLYHSTRHRVANSDFGLDKSRYHAIDAMAFVRIFGAGQQCLRSETDITTSDSQFEVAPGDIDWQHGSVADSNNIVAYCFWGTPVDDYDFDPYRAVERVVEKHDEIVTLESYSGTTTAVKQEVFERVGRLLGREYLDGELTGVKLHADDDDMLVMCTHKHLPGKYIIAPRIRY